MLGAAEGFALPPGQRSTATARSRTLRRRSAAPASPATRRISCDCSPRLLPEVGVADVTVRDFLPGRPNVWGVRKGAGGGPLPPARRAHRCRPCPRLARALGGHGARGSRSARRSSTARSGAAAPPTSRPASATAIEALRTLDASGVTPCRRRRPGFRRRRGERRAGHGRQRRHEGVRPRVIASGRDAAPGFRHLCRADDARRLFGADGLLHLPTSR